jgi:hypothetical protein
MSSLSWDVMQCYFVFTDVSGQPICPIFKGQAVQEGCFTLEDGTDKLYKNVGN